MVSRSRIIHTSRALSFPSNRKWGSACDFFAYRPQDCRPVEVGRVSRRAEIGHDLRPFAIERDGLDCGIAELAPQIGETALADALEAAPLQGGREDAGGARPVGRPAARRS